MPAHKAATPERKLRSRLCEPSPGPDSQRASCTSAIVNHSLPNVKVRQPSRIAPALVLVLFAFAVCSVTAHVVAAICGWRLVLCGGASIGVVFFMAFLVACVVAAVRHE